MPQVANNTKITSSGQIPCSEEGGGSDFLSLFLSLSLSFSLYVSVSRSLSLCLSLSLSVAPRAVRCQASASTLPLQLSLALALSLSRSLSFSLYLPLSFSLSRARHRVLKERKTESEGAFHFICFSQVRACELLALPVGFANYLQVDKLSVWYKSVNFGLGKCLVSPDWSTQIC